MDTATFPPAPAADVTASAASAGFGYWAKRARATKAPADAIAKACWATRYYSLIGAL